MIGTPFFGGHVVRWTPYFRGTSLTLLYGHILLALGYEYLSLDSRVRDTCYHASLAYLVRLVCMFTEWTFTCRNLYIDL